jgi:hypothetical protein
MLKEKKDQRKKNTFATKNTSRWGEYILITRCGATSFGDGRCFEIENVQEMVIKF